VFNVARRRALAGNEIGSTRKRASC
jgi:hypothetical protein